MVRSREDGSTILLLVIGISSRQQEWHQKFAGLPCHTRWISISNQREPKQQTFEIIRATTVTVDQMGGTEVLVSARADVIMQWMKPTP
jgi:hypothetical protein